MAASFPGGQERAERTIGRLWRHAGRYGGGPADGAYGYGSGAA